MCFQGKFSFFGIFDGNFMICLLKNVIYGVMKETRNVSFFCDNGVKYVSVDRIIGQRVIKKASVKVTVCCWSFYWRAKSIFLNCEQNLKIELIIDQFNRMQSQNVLKNHSKS